MTMNCIDIDSSQHELYDSWRKLYTVSFPIFEQRTQEQQEKRSRVPIIIGRV